MKAYIFLDLDINIIDGFSKEEIKHLEKYLDFIFKQENTDVFISKSFTDDLHNEKITEYLNSNIENLNKLINQAEIIDNHTMIIENSLEFHEWFGSSSCILSIDDIKVKIVEKQLSYGEVWLLIQKNPTTSLIHVLRSNLNTNPLQVILSKINCIKLFSETDFQNWFNAIKKKLIFKHNPKHDNIPTRRKQKGSPVNRLLCSHKEAQELLLTSIIDEKGEKKRYNIDVNPSSQGYRKLIEFMPEDLEQGIYHAYHLEDINNEQELESELSYLSNKTKGILKEWLKR